ncbi:MAG: ferritin [Turicibacter sp.]|nr:ferritin [Turicibacter sp.]
MLGEKITKAISNQINAEFYSAYLYLSMSTVADTLGFKGISHWFYAQSQEEMAHGVNMYHYLLECGVTPVLLPIEAPPATFGSAIDLFEAVLTHEKSVTAKINEIATLAMQEHDHASYQFILWYVKEQIEEESTAGDILNKVRMIGDDSSMLLNLDKELGSRIFVNPFPNV